MVTKPSDRILSSKVSKAIWKRPGFLVRRLHQIHVATFLRESAQSGITPIQWGILTIASGHPGVGHADFCEVLGLDASNVANVINRLVKRGLLRQKTSTEDRRKKEIHITDSGKELLAEVDANAKRSQDRLLSPLSREEKKLFMDLLTRLVQDNNHLGRTSLRFDK